MVMKIDVSLYRLAFIETVGVWLTALSACGTA